MDGLECQYECSRACNCGPTLFGVDDVAKSTTMQPGQTAALELLGSNEYDHHPSMCPGTRRVPTRIGKHKHRDDSTCTRVPRARVLDMAIPGTDNTRLLGIQS